jgi:8-oxo-dGTP pyrophosphatase MutT (NUDIX family)
MTFRPDVTVAAVVERDDRFLIVEEVVSGRRVFNQPAGHLEDHETLVEAVIRETLEETAWHFTPQAVTGIYQWRNPENDRSFLRVAFAGVCHRHEGWRPLDEGICRALWVDRGELLHDRDRLRSPMVLACIDDYLAGHRYSLDLVRGVDALARDAALIRAV